MYLLSLAGWETVGVMSEGTVDNISSGINMVWHGRLVHWSIPWNVSWLSQSVSVTILMVLVEYWLLLFSPLEMSTWKRWVSSRDTTELHPEQVWVVIECSVSPMMTCKTKTIALDTSSSGTQNVSYVEVCDGTSRIEALDWQFSDHEHSNSQSKPHFIGEPILVKGGSLTRSDENFIVFISWEPWPQDIKFFFGLWGPRRSPFFDFVRRDTETNQIVVLDVLWNLVVHHSSLSIIIGVLIHNC